MDTDKYEKMLYKLFLKGMIDEETLEEKMEERKNKKFEEDVNKAILEVMEGGYVKKTMARIYAEKTNKEE
jgi:DNA-binding transcriptional regulator YhcF (GntR family)